MKKQDCLTKSNFYETTELKLAALLLSEIPEASAEIFPQDNSFKKIIKINYAATYEVEVNRLLREFLERRAKVDVYRYNSNLNLLRDKLKT